MITSTPSGFFRPRSWTGVFDTVTIFYGSNGSGKTTLLNVIAEKLRALRGAPYNKSVFFERFVDQCELLWDWQTSWQDAMVITSDDVFDYLFDLRALNEGVDHRREDLMNEYLDLKTSHYQMRSLADYEQLKKVNRARRHSKSEFIRQNLVKNAAERSNGESALMYFSHKIESNQIYLLDEPRRTACRRNISRSCAAFWRIPPGFTTASSSSPPTRRFYWLCGAPASTIWTAGRRPSGVGQSWKM